MTAPEMTLHFAGASPFARKVRVVAAELGLADRIELREVHVTPVTHNPEYSGAVNPLRRVPAVTMPDGASLLDSTLICQYLDELAGGVLIPTGGERRWRALNAHAVADGVTELAVQLRYETFARPEALRWDELIGNLESKIGSGLDWFEARAGDGSRAPELDLGVVALVCALDYLDFRHPHLRWREGRPRLEAGHALLSARESFAGTRPG